MYTCTMHKYCIIVLTCTCTRSCKISDYQHLGLTRRSTQLAAQPSLGKNTGKPPSVHNINTIRKGLKSNFVVRFTGRSSTHQPCGLSFSLISGRYCFIIVATEMRYRPSFTYFFINLCVQSTCTFTLICF